MLSRASTVYMTTRIKICGITRQDDAAAVVRAGADALGLNFVAASPRHVAVEIAREIATEVAGVVTRVGLFVDPEPDQVASVLKAVDLDVLQFHGSESGEFCRSLGMPFVKALRMRGPVSISRLEEEYAGACCLLLDAYVPGLAGGTGARFDWSLWPSQRGLPLVLAGGLNPDNVAAAVARLDPWGVDVSGGVEGDRKGVKDADKIHRFVQEVKRARS